MRTKKNHINIKVTELLSILSLDHLNMKTFWDFHFKVFSLNLATLKLTQPLKSVITNVYPWIAKGTWWHQFWQHKECHSSLGQLSLYGSAQTNLAKTKQKKYHSLYMTNCKTFLILRDLVVWQLTPGPVRQLSPTDCFHQM